MPRSIQWSFALFLVTFAGAQLVRPDRTNPADPPSASLLSKAPANVQAILNRSCADCHSNNTRWPWYTNISPISWLIASHVKEARATFNFSTWTSYSADDQDQFLGNMCNLTKKGRMPLWSYLLIHRDAKLSAGDVAAICAWSEKMRDTLP
jgi:mono/diheme cytochrome c family protein